MPIDAKTFREQQRAAQQAPTGPTIDAKSFREQANQTIGPHDPDLIQDMVTQSGAELLKQGKAYGQGFLSGVPAGISATTHTGANLFMIADGAAKRLAEKTGLSYGGAFGRVEAYLRSDSEELMAKAQAEAPPPGLAGRVGQVVGGTPMALGEAAAATALAGPVTGFALLGALQRADQGGAEAAKGAIGGAALGSVFKFVPPTVGRTARAVTVGAAAGGITAAEGGTPEDIAISGLSTGALAALSRPQRRGVAPPVEPVPVEKPRLKLKLSAGGPPVYEEIRPTHSAVVVTPRTAETSVTFLGRDYSDVTPPDRVMNLNLQRVTGPMDLKAATADFVEAFRPQIDQARRGVISYEQTHQLANDLGLTFEQLTARRRGQALNAEEATAYRVMNRSAMEQWYSQAKKIQSGNASDVEKLEFLKSTSVAQAVMEQTLGATAEAGRTLSSFNQRVGPSTTQMKHLNELLRDMKIGPEGYSVEKLAHMVAENGNPQGLAGLARGLTKATTSEKLLEFWTNGLLSGIQSSVLDITSNAGTALIPIAKTAISAPIGAARATVNRLLGNPTPDRVYAREITARLHGFTEGAVDGLRLAGHTWRTGMPSSPTDLFSPATSVDVKPGGKIGGKVGDVIRAPSRWRMATDAFFQSVAYRSELRAQAVRAAMGEGRRGTALNQRVDEILRDPTEAQVEVAYQHARQQTFTAELGDTGKAIQALANSTPVARVIAPFVRTPINIVKYATKTSPFGLAMREVRADIAKGGAARDLAVAQMTIGAGIMAWAASQAAAGNITGSGPADPVLRKVWLDTHQPFSIKVGNQWVRYGIEPFGTIMGLAADYTDIVGHIDSATAEELATSLAVSFRRNLTNKTFIQNFIGAAGAFDDPVRNGPRFAERLAGSVVPSEVAQVARIQDPVLRDTRGAIDQIRSRIPGLSADLPAVIGVWGQPVMYTGGVGPDIASPFYQFPVKWDLTASEAVRLRAKLTQPGPNEKISGMELSAQEYSQLLQDSGQAAKRVVDQFVASPIYDSIPDPIKRETMEAFYNEANGQARARFVAGVAQQDPDRLRKAVLEGGLVGELLGAPTP